MFSLSRLKLTGIINLSTPTCVVAEVAECHGISINKELLNDNGYFSKMNSTINSVKVPMIQKNHSQSDIPMIARFVNPSLDVVWTLQTLMSSFNYMKEIIGITDKTTMRKQVRDLKTYGLQIPSDIKRWNCCMMYKACIIFDIPLTPNTTSKDMFICLKVISELEDDEINERIGLLSHRKILSLYNSMKNVKIVYESLMENDLSNKRYDENDKVKEVDNRYAIIQGISEGNVYTGSKFPLLSWLKKEKRPLTLFFDEGISKNFYTNQQLASVLKVEMASPPLYNLWTSLVEHRLLNTFYSYEDIVCQKALTSSETIIYKQNVNEVDKNDIVLFGVFRSSLVAYTYTELEELFKHNQTFKQPFGNDHFTLDNIVKLKALSLYYKKTLLTGTISEIEEKMKFMDTEAKEIYKLYLSFNSEQKSKCIDTLTSLLFLGMSMRGWLGENVSFEYINVNEINFPIELAPVGDQDAVDIKVSSCFFNYDKTNDDSPINFNLLKLYRYRGGIYEQSVSSYDGKTIGERLHIVKFGEVSENLSACIRLTSNWILATVSYYFKVFNVKCPFDINKVREIS
jgi:hypothetical protein